MNARDLGTFARLCAALEDPFADRAALLAAAGLDEARFRALSAAWGEHLAQAPADVERFARAYGAPRGAPGPQETVEIDPRALVRPITPFVRGGLPAPAVLPDPGRWSPSDPPAVPPLPGPASDGETLPMPSAGREPALGWREHAALRARMDRHAGSEARILTSAGIEGAAWAEADARWSAQLRADDVLRVQWRLAYERAGGRSGLGRG